MGYGQLSFFSHHPKKNSHVGVKNVHVHRFDMSQDRQTFRRILLKSAFKKRKMYEALLENVPMLRTLEVKKNSFYVVISWNCHMAHRVFYVLLYSAIILTICSRTNEWIWQMQCVLELTKMDNWLFDKVTKRMECISWKTEWFGLLYTAGYECRPFPPF